MSFNIIGAIFGLQFLIGLGIFVFLLKVLNDDLQELAMEKLKNFSFNKSGNDAPQVKVITRSPIKNILKARIEKEILNKNEKIKIDFSESADVKGGVIIEIGSQTIDCSLSSRLKNFW